MKMVLGVAGCGLPRYCPASTMALSPALSPCSGAGRGGGGITKGALGNPSIHTLGTQQEEKSIMGPQSVSDSLPGQPRCSWEPATNPGKGPSPHSFMGLPDSTVPQVTENTLLWVRETQEIKKPLRQKQEAQAPDEGLDGSGEGQAPRQVDRGAEPGQGGA